MKNFENKNNIKNSIKIRLPCGVMLHPLGADLVQHLVADVGGGHGQVQRDGVQCDGADHVAEQEDDPGKRVADGRVVHVDQEGEARGEHQVRQHGHDVTDGHEAEQSVHGRLVHDRPGEDQHVQRVHEHAHQADAQRQVLVHRTVGAENVELGCEGRD